MSQQMDRRQAILAFLAYRRQLTMANVNLSNFPHSKFSEVRPVLNQENRT